jgi:predicted CXXCH cytochrome family protein
MKKFLFIGVGSALIFTMGGVSTASADNGPHVSTAATVAGDYQLTAVGAGRCAGCHRTHTAKAELLLKVAQPQLCYNCHGAGAPGSTTDVVDGTDGGALALRGGGFASALIGTGAASKHMEPPTTVGGRWTASVQTVPVAALSTPTTSKHEIDGTTAGTMWGNGAVSSAVNVGKAGVVLECGSCHDPHGNGNYRILKPVPTDAAYVVTPAVVADPLAVPPVLAQAAVMSTTGVAIPDAAAKVYTTTNYWNVTDRAVPLVKGGPAPLAAETDGYITNVAQWCTTCHSRYLAKAPDYETNSGDAVFTYRHTSGRADKAGVSRPNCIQCHVSHGSNAAMVSSSIGVNPGDTPAVGADSRLLRVNNRGTCVMCHNM